MIEINKIYNEDCLETMARMPDKSVDFCFADPPYGVKKAEWDEDYPKFNFEKELLRISKRGFGITTGQNNIEIAIRRLKELGAYRGIHTARNLNGMTFNSIGFENIILTVMGGKIDRGTSFFEFVVRDEKPDHPSPKPIDYMIKMLCRFTEEGDLVYDPFMGSGTTAIACIKGDRRFIGSEINPEYCDIANKRIQQELSQLKLSI